MITLVGKRLKILRKRLGLTQAEFAERIPGKVDYTYVGKLERGGQYPSLKLLERIGRRFDVPLGYFFEDESFLKLFDLLPVEVRRLIFDKKLQKLLILASKFNEKKLDCLCRIIENLTEGG